MALPVSIAGVGLGTVHENPFHGPFKSSGGNFYGVFLDSTDKSLVEAWKATDPTSAFAEQDSADKPNLTNTAEAFAVHQEGDVLHIATQEDATGRVGYHTFDMATDQWAIINEAVVTPANDPGDYAVDISVRSDGDVIILYAAANDTITMNTFRRVKYARRESASWTVNVAVDNAGSVNWEDARIVRGSSDRMHFFFRDFTNHDAYQRALTSANALETFPSSFDATISTGVEYAFMRGVSYDASGTQKVRIPYLDSTGLGSVAKFDSADAPTVSVDAGVTTGVVQNNTESANGSLAANGTTLYFVWIDDVDADLDYDSNANDAGWGVDQSAVATIAGNSISANVYERAGNYRLGMFYLNGTTMTYNEVDLGSAGFTVTVDSDLDEATASLNAQQQGAATIAAVIDELTASLNAYMAAGPNIVSRLEEVQAALNGTVVSNIAETVVSKIDETQASLNAYNYAPATVQSTVDELTAALNALQSYPAQIVSLVEEVTAALAATHTANTPTATIDSDVEEVQAALALAQQYLQTIVSVLSEVAFSGVFAMLPTGTVQSVLDEVLGSLNAVKSYPFTVQSTLDEVMISLSVNQSYPLTIDSDLDGPAASLQVNQSQLVTIDSDLDEVAAAMELNFTLFDITVVTILEAVSASLAMVSQPPVEAAAHSMADVVGSWQPLDATPSRALDTGFRPVDSGPARPVTQRYRPL